MLDLEKIGNFIKQLREEKKMSQQELAKKVYCSRSTIAHIESGTVCPSYDKVKEFSRIFGVTEADIYSGKVLKKQDGIPLELYSVISIINTKSKRRFIVILILIILILFLLFSYYFFTYYNSIHVYRITAENSKYAIDDGFLIITKKEMYFTVSVENDGSHKLEKSTLRYKIDDSDYLITSTDSFNISFTDFYKYNAYLDYNNIKKNKGQFYLLIDADESVEKIDLTLTKDFSNNNLFLKSNKPIVDKNENKNYSSNIPPRIVDLFTKENNNIYSYSYKEKGILYAMSYDADNKIFNVMESRDNWNKNFVYYYDFKDIVYTYINGNKTEEYDFNINNMNNDEKEIYKYFKQFYIDKYF